MSYASGILADSPSGYWDVDETTGTVADDAVSTNDGTYVSSPTLAASPLVAGGLHAVTFSGGASLHELTLPGNLLTTNGSIELWFKWSSGTTLMRDHTSAGGSGWIIGFDNANTFAVRIAGGTTINTSKTTAQVRDGNKHHLVITKSGANVVVYLDNVSIGTSSSAGNTSSAAPWHIARNGSANAWSNATTDAIAIYPTALSSGQVSAHYTLGTVQTVALAQATEADTSQPFAKLKLRAVAQATETDTSQPVAKRKTRAVGQAAETDTSQHFAIVKFTTVGQAAETDTSQPVRHPSTLLVGRASQSDTAGAITPSKTASVGQATSTETGGAITPAKARTVAQATETDAAQSTVAAKSSTLGQVAETSTANPLGRLKVGTVAQVTSTETGGSVTPSKTRALGVAVETSTAQPFARVRLIPLGRAVSIEVSLPLTGAKALAVNQAGEDGSAGTMTSTSALPADGYTDAIVGAATVDPVTGIFAVAPTTGIFDSPANRR